MTSNPQHNAVPVDGEGFLLDPLFPERTGPIVERCKLAGLPKPLEAVC